MSEALRARGAAPAHDRHAANPRSRCGRPSTSGRGSPRCIRRARSRLLGMTTEGDRVQDRPLADIGGKGLFIKELEVAMAEGRADLAVHSLKDVPMDMPDGFALAAITAREDPRDAFVSNRYLDLAGLPGGARDRHVEPAARSAAARARSAARDPAAARQRQHAPAGSSTRGDTTRSSWPPRG